MDLRSGTPFWAVQSGSLGLYPPLTADVAADALIVGAGITGALIAHRLAAEGLRCVVLDKRDVGWGSTMASTALLQYEIDVPLRRLAQLTGLADALEAYRLCGAAVDFYDRLTASLGHRCAFRRCHSLFLARRGDEADDLRHECHLRVRAGLDARFLSGRELNDRFGIDRPGAILSSVAGTLEPYRLTHALLADSQRRGASIADRTAVVRLQPLSGGGFVAHTDRGPTVRAAHVVIASGYEAAELLPPDTVELRTTFAVATEPLEPALRPRWLDDHVLWDSGDPYFYARAGPDGRVLMGGEDVPGASPLAGDDELPARVQKIASTWGRLAPNTPVEVAFAWSGVFAATTDGLGYLGRHPACPGVEFALGYGGNGMVFAALFADMMAAILRGQSPPGSRLFRFNRAR